MMKACGVNWARLHDAGTEYSGWWNLAQEKGKWTFMDDDCVQQAYNDAVGEIFTKVPNAGGKPIYMSEGQGGSTGSSGVGCRMTGLYKRSITWQPEEDLAGLAEKNCRYTVSLLAQKVAKVFLYSAHGYSSLAQAPNFLVLLGADGYPHPSLAAYVHLTRSLEGKRFARKVALGENRFAYLFAGRNGTCAVLCGGRDARLPFIRDPAIRWTDLFGNPLTASATLPGTMRYAESALSPEELEVRLTHP